ncbi:hypothetical protein [Halomarina oriensis]|uniref:Uncharacterized protein n=1 Tax=Halomarina oriensis TaxID=671145 RepID=A0A6B0GT14_9EURY|nr:hypothetical protein [Halomarina oriensis]MWG34838.1 hypothetical protein [Halomarina oriensis]
MSTAPGTQTIATHPLSNRRAPCRVLGEVFRPNANQSDTELFVRVEFENGARYRVEIDAVHDYE